jgi:hypothetical protein
MQVAGEAALTAMGVEYKVVELSIVTDETIEEAVNAWVGRGWLLDGIRFVTSEASRRPSMAFVSFTRETMAPLTLPPEDRESAEHIDRIDETVPRPMGPRLVKAPDEEG